MNGSSVPVVMVDECGGPRVSAVDHRIWCVEDVLLEDARRMDVAVDLRARGVRGERVIRVGNLLEPAEMIDVLADTWSCERSVLDRWSLRITLCRGVGARIVRPP